MATEGRGTSKASLFPEFVDNVAALAEAAGTQADATLSGYARPARWFRPPSGAAWSPTPWGGAPLDVPGVGVAFSRARIGQATADVYQALEPGTSGDAAALKIQASYLAALERAYRTRHATGPRCHAMAAGRRAGHADPAGPLLNGVVRYVQDVLQAGQT